MDPLSALRDFTFRGQADNVVRLNDEFHFGSDYVFPCNIETAYRSKQGNLYTLETLVYFIQNQHLKHAEYFHKARTLRLPPVTLPDRKPLLDYLTGKVASVDAIEFFHPKLTDYSVAEYRPEDAIISGSRLEEINVNEDLKNFPEASPVQETVNFIELIRSIERPLKDRETLLECKNRDFYSLLTTLTRQEEERQRMESHQRKDGLVAKSRLMGADDRGLGFRDELGFDGPKSKMLKTGRVGEGVPIILVPSASQTLITIYNVKEFLEDGVFVSSDVRTKQMKGPKPDCVTVQKKFSKDKDKVVTAYEVRDKPSALKGDDWDRVVAVFVLGKEWQFKDWPFKDHVEIFNKIIGFYMRFEDDSLESAKNVKQWNVKIISISKNKRHQDRAAALEVWDRLEQFMGSRAHA